MKFFNNRNQEQAAEPAGENFVAAPLNFRPEFPASMKAAIASTAGAMEQQGKIEIAFNAARGAVAEAERHLREAQEHLSTTEAAAAVDNVEVDRAARKRLTACRDELAFAQARRGGLEQRLKAAVVATNEQRAALAREFRAWTRAQAEHVLEAVYNPSLLKFLDAMRAITAVGVALSSTRLVAVARHSVIPDPADPLRDLANPKRLAWREHPESMVLYNRLAAQRAEIERLLGADFSDPVVEEGNNDAAA